MAVGRVRQWVLSVGVVFAVGVAGCDATGDEGATEPTFEQAQAIAEEQLADAGCEFQVSDDSTDGLEQKTLECLISEGGQDALYTVFTYERDLEVEETDQYFPGLTTAERCFENDNITVDPGGGNPEGVQLDAEEFATAVQEDCGCGEVLTPEA